MRQNYRVVIGALAIKAIVYENSDNHVLCLVSDSAKQYNINPSIQMVVNKEKIVRYSYFSLEKQW